MLPEPLFARLQGLARARYGVDLQARHRGFVERRARRLGHADDASLSSLLDAAERGDPAAARRVVGLVTVHHTSFFREPAQLDLAAEHALYAAHRRGAARVWCAAASTGQEPLSQAMVLHEVFRTPESRARVSLLATDVCEDSLAAAERATYGERDLAPVEPWRRARHFTECAGRWRATDALRAMVTYRALNLVDLSWGIDAGLDVALCRNVLMYFDEASRYAVLERVASLLRPDGVLVVDPSEHLGRAGHLFSPGRAGVYPRRPPRGASARRHAPETPT